MLFIYDYIIDLEQINIMEFLLKIFGISSTELYTRDLIKLLVEKESYDKFYSKTKDGYEYRLTVSSIENLDGFMNFFKNHKLLDDEYISIKRHGLNLKQVYEVIEKYKDFDFVNKIIIEQHDKEEWLDFEYYKEIYSFLKEFDDQLPENPKVTDIIVNAYDYVKQRQYLREEDSKSHLSKKFSTSVLIPNIVCAGFVKQFNAILKEYNIPCFEYNYIPIGEKEGHSVSIVEIEEMGVYFFDITRDSYNPNQSELENRSKYSGFMLPYTYYEKLKNSVDNFSNELSKSTKELELRKKYAEQQILQGKDEKIDLFNDNEFKKYEILHTLIDTDFELLNNNGFFNGLSEQKEKMTAKIYGALLAMKSNFGSEICNDDEFIDILISAKRNSDLKENRNYYIKAAISRFNDSVNLSETTGKILQKLQKSSK